jgi:hypothetical protein
MGNGSSGACRAVAISPLWGLALQKRRVELLFKFLCFGMCIGQCFGRAVIFSASDKCTAWVCMWKCEKWCTVSFVYEKYSLL